MLDLTTFETFKNIDLSVKITKLLNQYLINDSKIIKNLLILYNEGKKENLMSEITLKEMILNLSVDLGSLSDLKDSQFIPLDKFLSGDKQLITFLTGINIGIGSKGIAPNPWYLKMQNQLKKEMKK